MKNIYLLPTEEPSRLFLDRRGTELNLNRQADFYSTGRVVYITSDEKIEKGDWYKTGKFIWKMMYPQWGEEGQGDAKKIILTTDPKLIDDGVQSIDDEFLKWFVKNPTVESVEFEKEHDDTVPYPKMRYVYPYSIIIPKEEPKQETLEEAAEKEFPIVKRKTAFGSKFNWIPKRERNAFIKGIQWQQGKMYSEEEVLDILYQHTEDLLAGKKVDLEDWFEQVKRKSNEDVS
jgi:hypothetical protein